MEKLNLSAERVHLLQKVAKKERDPLEILFCTVLSTLVFIFVYALIAFKFRFEEPSLAWVLGPGIIFVICCLLSFFTYKKIKNSMPGDRRNLFINLTVCFWAALLAGIYCGDRTFWQYTTNIWSYRDLISYVDINPASDHGQAYMDSGHVYFKFQSKVLTQKSHKFHNGDTYCVAPIIHGNFIPTPGDTSQIMNGYILPPSGSYDWWAVGTNCCDSDAPNSWTCGEAHQGLTPRSGMRLLSDNQRPYYLLAVQEWSATYGLPVQHPLFFTMVKDPLETEDQYASWADRDMWNDALWFLLAAFIISFLIHVVLHRNKVF